MLREGEIALNKPPNCSFRINQSALKPYTHKLPSQPKKAVFMYLYTHTPIKTHIYIAMIYIIHIIGVKIVVGKEEDMKIAG